MRFACVCSVFVFFTVLLLLLCCCLLLCFVHSGRALFFIERAVYLCVVCVSFSCVYFIEKETKPTETKTPGTLPPSLRANSLPPSLRANSLPPSLRANSLPPSLTSDVSVCFIVDCLYAGNLCFLLLFYLCLLISELSFSFCLLRTLLFPVFLCCCAFVSFACSAVGTVCFRDVV